MPNKIYLTDIIILLSYVSLRYIITIHSAHVNKLKLYFIKKGKRKVEVRLNDEKRRKIKVGDTIEFIRFPEQDNVIKVHVTELRKYETFREMHEDIPFVDFDGEGWSMQEMIEGTYEIYTPEQEKEWGTLAITIKY